MAIQERDISQEEFDPIVPNPVCPHCHTENVLDKNTYGFYKGPVPCLHCPEAYMVHFSNPPGTPISQRLIGGYMVSPVRPIGDPVFLDDLDGYTIPAAVRRDFRDAVFCRDYQLPRQAAGTCRYVIQRALLEKGVGDDTPMKMVNKARHDKLLSEITSRLCQAAVFLGSKGSHPPDDYWDEIGNDEATLALVLTRRILTELFQKWSAISPSEHRKLMA